MGKVSKNEPQKSLKTRRCAEVGTSKEKQSTAHNVEPSEESNNVKKRRNARKRTLDTKTEDATDNLQEKRAVSSTVARDEKELDDKLNDTEQNPIKGPGIPYIPPRKWNNGKRKNVFVENFDIKEYTRKSVPFPLERHLRNVQPLPQRLRSFFTKKLEKQTQVAPAKPEIKVPTEAQKLLESQKPQWFPRHKWTTTSHIPVVGHLENLDEKRNSAEKPPWIPHNRRTNTKQLQIEGAPIHPDRNHRRKTLKPRRIPPSEHTATDQQKIDDSKCSEDETETQAEQSALLPIELEENVEVDQIPTTTNNNLILNLCSITLNMHPNSFLQNGF